MERRRGGVSVGDLGHRRVGQRVADLLLQSNVFSEARRKQNTEQYAVACVRYIDRPTLPIHLVRQQYNRFFDEEQCVPVGGAYVFQLPTVWVPDEFVL